ncbi:MAG: class I SAM-dependent methyltransferase [Cyclobacteriaceae bacterium]|nr:class I SAM-dependent methyltransferase [Cyclobacteriaceae bacterium]
MEFIDEQLAKYVEEHTQPESDLLRKINRETHLEVLRPRMLSGHLQGRVLSMFSKMIQPKQVLEIGTYTGYSALCIAEGLAAGGKIITIDKNEELEERVKKYFSESPYKGQIDFRVGDALAIIPELKEDFDLVFIDADKANYLNYFNLVIDRLHSGGYIIADNVLWSGKVVEPLEDDDVDTRALLEFNKAVQNDNRVENVLFPIRDGLMVIRKI